MSWAGVSNEKQRSDQRILGNSEFVQEVISGLDDLVRKNLRLSGQRIDINALALQVCRKYNISLGELRSGSRRRIVVEARGSISWIAVKELGYSGADVDQFLGVTNSCVTRFVASGKKPDVDDLVRKLRTFCTNVPILHPTACHPIHKTICPHFRDCCQPSLALNIAHRLEFGEEERDQQCVDQVDEKRAHQGHDDEG